MIATTLVSLALRPDINESPVREALVYGDWCAHRHFDDVGRWRVSHLHSGLGLSPPLTEEEAVDLLMLVGAIPAPTADAAVALEHTLRTAVGFVAEEEW